MGTDVRAFRKSTCGFRGTIQRSLFFHTGGRLHKMAGSVYNERYHNGNYNKEVQGNFCKIRYIENDR